jgi:integrase
MNKSSQSAPTGKAGDDRPAKPYEGFPLFPHRTGRWAKKIKGRFCYYGPWRGVENGGWQAALDEYEKYRDADYTGRARHPDGNQALTLRELVNRFLTAKEQLRDSGDITPRTVADYHTVCGRTIKHFGAHRAVADITAEDFSAFRTAIAKTRGPVAFGNDITRVRIMFKWAYDSGLIDSPVRYGQGFQKPSRKVLRKVREAKGPRMFTAEEIRRMLAASEHGLKSKDDEWIVRPSRPLAAMILLAINCGFGNQDCATLPVTAVDLKGRWVSFPRPKTGVARRCPLWKETVKALETAIANRPKPRDDETSKLVFVTSRLKSWAKDRDDNPISKETAKLLKGLGLHRPGLNFYALRHTFQTIGQKTLDKDAVRSIMGHADETSDMSARYSEERPDDDRLTAVVKHIHEWLYPPKARATNRRAVESKDTATKRIQRRHLRIVG